MNSIKLNRKQFYNLLEAIKYTNINCKIPISHYACARLLTLKNLYSKISYLLATNFDKTKINLSIEDLEAILFTASYIPDDLKNEIFYKNKKLSDLLIDVGSKVGGNNKC